MELKLSLVEDLQNLAVFDLGPIMKEKKYLMSIKHRLTEDLNSEITVYCNEDNVLIEKVSPLFLYSAPAPNPFV